MTAVSVPLAALPAMLGRELGPTIPRPLPQRDVDAFADLTGDRQWVHVDPVRARPHGGTIAHGLLVLGVVGGLWPARLPVPDCERALNYGLDRVRFLSPVPVGSAAAARARVGDVRERPDGVLVGLDLRVGIPGAERPSMVATSLVLFTTSEH